MHKLAAAVLCLVAAGCVDLDQEFVLNPDASGKVKIVAISAPLDLDIGPKKSPEEKAKKAARETLEKSTGVDAWSDVSTKVRDDGKTEFRGTAYFKDFAALELSVMGGKGDAKIELVKEPAGGLTLRLAIPDKAARAEAPKLSDDQVKAKIREERAQFQQSKGFMEAFFKDLKVRTRYALPGSVSEAAGFRKTGDSAVELSIEGAALLKTLEELVMDDAFMRKQVESGKGMNDGPPTDEAALQKIFGSKTPPRAVVKSATKAAFDYEAEAAKARAAMPALLEQFGAPPPAKPAAPGSGFKSVKVAGARLVRETDPERDLRPFHAGEPGLSFAVVADFPGSVLAVKGGKLEKAVSDAGENLLPANEFNREIRNFRLTDDRRTVAFDVDLSLPGAKARGVKELSGTMEYLLADKISEIDLGLEGYATGSKGKKFDAAIGEVKESEFQEGSWSIELTLKISRDSIESIVFLDEKGQKMAVDPAGYSSSEDECTLAFRKKGRFPAKGKIVAKVYDDPQAFLAPFKIVDVDLLGRPQK